MRFRVAKTEDLEACLLLLRTGFHRPESFDVVRLSWKRLLEDESGELVIVEDPSQPHPLGIVAFIASVFVTDAFVDDFYRAPGPDLSGAIYGRILAGRSPVLTASQVRSANSGHGLNLVIVHIGVRTADIHSRRHQRALGLLSQAFVFSHSGYRLAVILAEVSGHCTDYVRAAGFRPLNGFAHDARLGDVPRDSRPHLFILRREWIAPAFMSPSSLLFDPPEASLGLSSGEQRVLLGALQGQSDMEIAANRGVSVYGVKKAWRQIYDRLATSVPHVVGSTGSVDLLPPGSCRGREKRRPVIEYFRYHLEELRPVERPRTPSLQPRRR